MTKRKFRSEIAGAMHETVRGMHKLGVVDKQTMREFDVRCLTAVEELSSHDIVALREKAGVSQAIFARAERDGGLCQQDRKRRKATKRIDT